MRTLSGALDLALDFGQRLRVACELGVRFGEFGAQPRAVRKERRRPHRPLCAILCGALDALSALLTPQRLRHLPNNQASETGTGRMHSGREGEPTDLVWAQAATNSGCPCVKQVGTFSCPPQRKATTISVSERQRTRTHAHEDHGSGIPLLLRRSKSEPHLHAARALPPSIRPQPQPQPSVRCAQTKAKNTSQRTDHRCSEMVARQRVHALLDRSSFHVRRFGVGRGRGRAGCVAFAVDLQYNCALTPGLSAPAHEHASAARKEALTCVARWKERQAHVLVLPVALLLLQLLPDALAAHGMGTHHLRIAVACSKVTLASRTLAVERQWRRRGGVDVGLDVGLDVGCTNTGASVSS